MGGSSSKHGDGNSRDEIPSPVSPKARSSTAIEPKNVTTPDTSDNPIGTNTKSRASTASSSNSGDRFSKQANAQSIKDAAVKGRTIIVKKNPKEIAIVCVAIDFGTTYSGFAYTFYNGSGKIFTPLRKAPTVVLLDPDKNPVAFGDKARLEYQELVSSKQHTYWYLFEHFKMALFARGMSLDRDVTVKDVLGKEMKAIEVFTHAIKFLKKEAMEKINYLTVENEPIDIDIEATHIHWVLTVPAIWNDMSKKFMRDAATMAGIPDQLLTLALEPEAASLYCREFLGIADPPAGHRYMVLDLGGGTADITIHEVNDDGTLSEVRQPTGGDFGGTNVDNEFINMLVQLVGAQVFQAFKRNHADDFFDLMHDFEIKKRYFSGDRGISLKLPVKLNDMYLDDVGDTLESSIHTTPFGKNLIFRGRKINISIEMAKTWFDNVLDSIVKLINELLTEVNGVNQIYLVGGFAESPYLQAKMKSEFAKMVVVPNDPSMAVLKGAIIYGKKPLVIASRVCKYTYGIARMMKFKPFHTLRKKITIDGVDYCDDLFNKHIEIGTRVSVADSDKAIAHVYFPTMADMKQAVLEVYASTDTNPKCVDDEGCHLVGLIKLDIDPQGDIFSKLLVKMIFGGTELRIEVLDVKHNTVTISSVDFVG